ncbi:MAG: Photosystem assembly protein Ycf3, partial [Pseudomonadota bacterium]
MFKHLACGLILFLTLAAASSRADTPSLRPTYGQSPYPIWSELSYFESDTISLRHRAEQNDPDALLAFYILASGLRNLADYENSQRRVKAFMEGLPADVRSDKNQYRQAERVYQAMHQHFFVTPDSHQKGGYDEDQSAINAIFSSGQFNCISSSMLFIVLARHLEFTPRAAVLPSHVFVELNLNDALRVEVETTSPAGFGVTHDEAFYQAAAAWFKERGLQASTLQEYQGRQLISPLHLAALNMLIQHTDAQRMSRTDSARLGEISAFLDPTSVLAQSRRLEFYLSEVEALSGKGAWFDLLRMYAAVLADLRQVQPLFSNNKTIQHSIYWLHSRALFAYANTGKLDGYKTQINILLSLPNHLNERSVFEAALLDS